MIICKDWSQILQKETEREYYRSLSNFINQEYKEKTIFPRRENVFKALQLTSYKSVKVVCLGQDPYQTPGFAMGLAFSVNKGVTIPKSLMNIYKELKSDIGCYIPNHGDLSYWAEQGVLLLNTTLTVISGKSASHTGVGWEALTDEIIRKVNEKETPVTFILWGRNARNKKSLITNEHHLIIESAHPSPLSAYNGFFGSRPFSRTNDFLWKNGLSPIDWQIRDI